MQSGFLLICRARCQASRASTKQDISSLFKKPNYETQGNRLSFRGICGYATALWPPVPDVVKRTLGLRAINCSFTDEFMHRNTRPPRAPKPAWHQRERKTPQTRRQRVKGGGPWPSRHNTKTKRGPVEAFPSANEEIHFTGNYTGVKIHIGALRRPRGAQPRFSRQTERLWAYISSRVQSAGRQTVLDASTSVPLSLRRSTHPLTHVAHHHAPLWWYQHIDLT